MSRTVSSFSFLFGSFYLCPVRQTEDRRWNPDILFHFGSWFQVDGTPNFETNLKHFILSPSHSSFVLANVRDKHNKTNVKKIYLTRYDKGFKRICTRLSNLIVDPECDGAPSDLRPARGVGNRFRLIRGFKRSRNVFSGRDVSLIKAPPHVLEDESKFSADDAVKSQTLALTSLIEVQL